MAGILNLEKWKKENRKELDELFFVDLVNGFLLKMKELGRYNFDVEFDRNIGGRVIHQINPDWKMTNILRKIKRSRNHRKLWEMKMKDIELSDIDWVFGSNIELKNSFLDEIYYKYYL